jgi:hypothetical protein
LAEKIIKNSTPLSIEIFFSKICWCKFILQSDLGHLDLLFYC